MSNINSNERNNTPNDESSEMNLIIGLKESSLGGVVLA